jgi:hypothetical protein
LVEKVQDVKVFIIEDSYTEIGINEWIKYEKEKQKLLPTILASDFGKKRSGQIF